MEALIERINGLINHWTKVQTDNVESTIKHAGAIEAAKIILNEIAALSVSASDAEVVPEAILDN